MGTKCPTSFLRILPDYFCLLEFECQDLRGNTATVVVVVVVSHIQRIGCQPEKTTLFTRWPIPLLVVC